MSRKSNNATANKTNKPANAGASSETPNAGESKKTAIYYAVFVDTYVSNTEILSKGVYKTYKPIARLDRSAAKYVLKFDENTVPEKTIHEIAEQLKISLFTEKGKAKKTADLLAEMCSEI